MQSLLIIAVSGSHAAIIFNELHSMHYIACVSINCHRFPYTSTTSCIINTHFYINQNKIIINDPHMIATTATTATTTTVITDESKTCAQKNVYLPSNKTLWKCTADQEHVDTDKNPY